jgi:hypothetical protein
MRKAKGFVGRHHRLVGQRTPCVGWSATDTIAGIGNRGYGDECMTRITNGLSAESGERRNKRYDDGNAGYPDLLEPPEQSQLFLGQS